MSRIENEIQSRMDSHAISPRLQDYFNRCIEFHTYPAPGLLIGVFMVDYAVEQLGATPGEKLYSVCETQKCAPDPLQVLLHCTSGNHRLRVIPMGRFALTLNRPSIEPFTEGIRVFIDPGKLERYPLINSWFTNDPSFNQREKALPLIDEIFRAGRDILSAEKVRVKVTPKQKWQSGKCRICGEMVPSDLLEEGVCIGCGPNAYYKKA
ncbi:MAG TPA: FmdE family protein [Methanoregulaceae archaeon]|mgnify:CR=1 FL=1|nr:FmdE family protein [Methanoregulaceae archaeon]HOB59119.1 FmdE family protein [Methanoregulaceae archaeon]HOH80289.1 FmdE family protein [Methanoregulaceae archaeon]HOU81296.1 FmdE family protein [Methanoregulaceae archaeon]HPW11293.1 FmdE family protein [Methanoregulaceae archaeon]